VITILTFGLVRRGIHVRPRPEGGRETDVRPSRRRTRGGPDHDRRRVKRASRREEEGEEGWEGCFGCFGCW